MKFSVKLTALVCSLMCVTPIWGKDKLLGAFKNNFHDIGGKIYAKGDNQLVIEGFTYDGQGPDAFFYVGTEGNKPSSNGIILAHPFEGKHYDTDDKSAPILEKLFDGNQDDIVLTLPDNVKVKDLKWISIWCRRFAISFGQFIFPAELSEDSNEAPITDVIQPECSKDNLLGAFKNNFHGIGGKIYSCGDSQLVVEGFTYDGQGPDSFFWVGTEGNKPSSNGIILPHPFEGKFYEIKDQSAPILKKQFDGSQNDIVLTLPDDVKVKDLKWISIWCRRFAISFGQFIFPAQSSDNVGSVPRTAAIQPESSGPCKSNQKCIPLRECPYTFKLLAQVLSSNNREEKNNKISEIRQLVCNPSDRSVCCDLEGETEEEAEAEAEGYEEGAKPEGDEEEAKPEGDEEDEKLNIRTEHLMNQIVYDFPHKVGDITQLAEHELAGEVWALDEDTLEFRKFIYVGDGPDAYFMIGTHDAADKPNLDDGIPIPYSKDKVFPQKFYSNDDDIPKLPAFKSETFKITLPPGVHVSDLKWLSVYCRKYTKDFGNISFE